MSTPELDYLANCDAAGRLITPMSSVRTITSPASHAIAPTIVYITSPLTSQFHIVALPTEVATRDPLGEDDLSRYNISYHAPSHTALLAIHTIRQAPTDDMPALATESDDDLPRLVDSDSDFDEGDDSDAGDDDADHEVATSLPHIFSPALPARQDRGAYDAARRIRVAARRARPAVPPMPALVPIPSPFSGPAAIRRRMITGTADLNRGIIFHAEREAGLDSPVVRDTALEMSRIMHLLRTYDLDHPAAATPTVVPTGPSLTRIVYPTSHTHASSFTTSPTSSMVAVDPTLSAVGPAPASSAVDPATSAVGPIPNVAVGPDPSAASAVGPAPSAVGPAPVAAGPAPPTLGPTPSTIGPAPSVTAAVGPVPSAVGPALSAVGPAPSVAVTVDPASSAVGPAPAAVGPAPAAVGPTPATAGPAPSVASAISPSRSPSRSFASVAAAVGPARSFTITPAPSALVPLLPLLDNSSVDTTVAVVPHTYADVPKRTQATAFPAVPRSSRPPLPPPPADFERNVNMRKLFIEGGPLHPRSPRHILLPRKFNDVTNLRIDHVYAVGLVLEELAECTAAHHLNTARTLWVDATWGDRHATTRYMDLFRSLFVTTVIIETLDLWEKVLNKISAAIQHLITQPPVALSLIRLIQAKAATAVLSSFGRRIPSAADPSRMLSTIWQSDLFTQDYDPCIAHLAETVNTLCNATPANTGRFLCYQDIAAAAASETTAILLFQVTHPELILADDNWRDIYERVPILEPAFGDFHPPLASYPARLQQHPMQRTRRWNDARRPTTIPHVGIRIHFNTFSGIGADAVCIRAQPYGAQQMASDFDRAQHISESVPRILLLDTLRDNSDWHECPQTCGQCHPPDPLSSDSAPSDPDNDDDDNEHDQPSLPAVYSTSPPSSSSLPAMPAQSSSLPSASARRRLRLRLRASTSQTASQIPQPVPPAAPPSRPVLAVVPWFTRNRDYAPGLYACDLHQHDVELERNDAAPHDTSLVGCDECCLYMTARAPNNVVDVVANDPQPPTSSTPAPLASTVATAPDTHMSVSDSNSQ